MTYKFGSAIAGFEGTTLISDADSPYAVLAADQAILVDSTAAVVTVTLPAAPLTNRRIEVKDKLGQAAAFAITVDGNGKNIDGVATQVLNVPYASITIIYNGTQWNIV